MRWGGGTAKKSAAGSGFVSAKGLNPTTQDQEVHSWPVPNPRPLPTPPPPRAGQVTQKSTWSTEGPRAETCPLAVGVKEAGPKGSSWRTCLSSWWRGSHRAVGSCPAELQQLTPAVGTPAQDTEAVTNPHPITAPTQGRAGLTLPQAGAGPKGT